jgi:hypothetical protein
MELWTLKEAAEKTRMSEAYWRKQVLLRRIPVIKIGRCVRLDAGVVRSFLLQGVRPATTPTLGAVVRLEERDERRTH